MRHSSRNLITFQPGGWGGNHMHERAELMAAVQGNPTIIYFDKFGKRIEESMGPEDDGSLFAYNVESWTPHLVVNQTDSVAALYELRNMRESPNYANLLGTPEDFAPVA